MRTKLVLSIAITFWFWNANSQNLVANGDFETWTPIVFEVPLNYDQTSNEQAFYEDGVFNCIKTTDAFSGNYAIRLTTKANNGFGHFATKELSGNPPWNGGVPYNQRPAGISGYYKSAIPEGDSALIAVNFSVNGSGIGLYLLKFSGTHETYTPFSLTFDPPLSVNPDSVLLAATSSDYFNGIAIPGSMIQLDNISFTGVSSQPLLLNCDFEQWKTFTNNELAGWYLTTDLIENGTAMSSDAYQGNYAVQLTTFLRTDNENRQTANPAQISTGYYDENCSCMAGGKPYTLLLDTLAFHYKYSPMRNDHAQVDLMFKKDGVEVGWAGAQLSESTNYAYYEIPFKAEQIPDSVIINIHSSLWDNNSTAYAGSTLKVDQLHFKSQLTTGIKAHEREKQFTVFPNPSDGMFSFRSELEFNRIEIFNTRGEQVFATPVNSNHSVIDLNKHPQGVYFYQLKNKKQLVKTGKIIIE